MTTTLPANIHPHLTLFTLWVMTIATCLVVANIYYNQPLLADIAHTVKISDKKPRRFRYSACRTLHQLPKKRTELEQVFGY